MNWLTMTLFASLAILLSGCLKLGTSIGVGSNGVSGGVVISGSTELGNGVSVGTSVGAGL